MGDILKGEFPQGKKYKQILKKRGKKSEWPGQENPIDGMAPKENFGVVCWYNKFFLKNWGNNPNGRAN